MGKNLVYLGNREKSLAISVFVYVWGYYDIFRIDCEESYILLSLRTEGCWAVIFHKDA